MNDSGAKKRGLVEFPASFLAIDSTIFGRRSAIPRSTMLAIELASVGNAARRKPSAAALLRDRPGKGDLR
jgi:hypothetical protein